MEARAIPQKLSFRHRTVAYLVAIGKKPIDIARVTGYSPTRIGQLLATPMFTELVRELQADLKDDTFAEFLTAVNRERMPTFDVLTNLRDHGTPEDAVRLNAAKAIVGLDPVLAARLAEESDDGGSIRIPVPRGTFAMMIQAMNEEEGREPALIDITPTRPTASSSRPRTIDDLLEEDDIE
jgi:hypothetical protein